MGLSSRLEVDPPFREVSHPPVVRPPYLEWTFRSSAPHSRPGLAMRRWAWSVSVRR